MIRFKMQNIKVNQFAILVDSKPEESIKWTINFEINFSKEKGLLSMTLKTDILTEKSILIETLQITCTFAIHQDDYRQMCQGDNITLPAFLLTHMAVHVVGTARGILFCKNEGTPLADFIMPQINVAEIFKEDVPIK